MCFFNSSNVLKTILVVISFILVVPYNTSLAKASSILACVIILVIFRKNMLRILLSIPLDIRLAYGVFLGSILLSSIMVGDKRSITEACDWIRYSILFILTYFLTVDSKGQRYVFWGMSAGIVCLAGFGLFEYVISGCSKRISSFTPHVNHLASMIEMTLPFILVYFVETIRLLKPKKVEILWGLCSILIGVVTLYITQSRGAIIGISLGLVLSTFICGNNQFNAKKVLIVFCVSGVVALMSLFVLYHNNGGTFSRRYDGERILLLKSSYNMWSDNKFIGVGLRNWKREYQKNYILPEAKERNLTIPHNIFAYYFSATGLVGGLGFCLFLVLVAKYLFSRTAYSLYSCAISFAMLWSFFAITIHGLVDIGITDERIYKLFCGELGITVGLLENAYRKFEIASDKLK